MHLRKRGDRCINLDRVREFAVDAPGALAWYAHEHATKIHERYEVQLPRRWRDAQALVIAQDGPEAAPQVAIFAFEDLDAGDGAGDGMLRTGNGSGD